MLQRELLYALMGTGFTCLATVLGAGMVLFFKKDKSTSVAARPMREFRAVRAWSGVYML